MNALLRPVVSASADTAIYQRVDSACSPLLLVGVGHRRVRQAVLRGVPTDLHDRTSEDGSVEARSKRGQMQVGRPAAADCFGRHPNSNACAFRQAIFAGDAIPEHERDLSRISFANGDVENRAFVTICHARDPSFIFKCKSEVNTRLNERFGRASINRRARKRSY